VELSGSESGYADASTGHVRRTVSGVTLKKNTQLPRLECFEASSATIRPALNSMPCDQLDCSARSDSARFDYAVASLPAERSEAPVSPNGA